MRVRSWTVAAFVFASLLLGAASSQAYRLGAKVAPGTLVDFPLVQTVTGETIKKGVPTVVIFAKVKGCPLCEAVPEIATSWIRKYQNLQVFVVETSSPRVTVEAWAQEHDVPIVFDADSSFKDAFETNLTLLYLLDESGMVRDKVRPNSRRQWVDFDHQLARADSGDWQAVDDNVVALPVIGGVARSSPVVPLGTGAPALVIVGDGYCSFCREIVSSGLQKAVKRLLDEQPDMGVYLLEPSLESIAEGFYGFAPYVDYGPRAVFAEYAELFGEEAAGADIMNYLSTGEPPKGMFVPTTVWPDDGWADGVSIVRYEVGGPDDPVTTWGYGEKDFGVLVFDGEGRYLGPAPFFTGETGNMLVLTVKKLLGMP